MMTNTPDLTPTPESSRSATEPGSATEPRSATEPVSGRTLDEGTFTELREPRAEARLALADGKWHQISPKYVWVQLISSGIGLAVVVAVLLLLTQILHWTWAWIPGGILIAILVWTLALVPRQARAYGYQLREDDLVFRRGILWQRLVAVPYGRMQLVDITHGPLDRGFGIAQLKLVTAAAATGVVIPGLPQETAEALRDVLIEVAETRRTGL
jgi:membrane protein YdbS with pleckstrin-like domain